MAEVRATTPDDAESIRRVHLAAFPTPMEANLVEALERDGNAVISLVAVDGSAIVGHILLSRMHALGDGQSLDALGLAPVAVMPDVQGKGIGSTLIEAGLAKAQASGTEIVFLLGEPDYYGRFGFERATAAPFASPYAGPYFQAKVLTQDFNQPSIGRADYAPAFAALS